MLIAVLVVVLIAAAGGVLYLVTSGDDDSENASSEGAEGSEELSSGEAGEDPESTVRAFMEAEEAGDCEGALDLITPNGLEAGYGTSDPAEALSQCQGHVATEQAQGITRERTLHDVETETDGDQATVALTMTATATDGTREETESFRQKVELVMDGTWKIENLGSVESIDEP